MVKPDVNCGAGCFWGNCVSTDKLATAAIELSQASPCSPPHAIPSPRCCFLALPANPCRAWVLKKRVAFPQYWKEQSICICFGYIQIMSHDPGLQRVISPTYCFISRFLWMASICPEITIGGSLGSLEPSRDFCYEESRYDHNHSHVESLGPGEPCCPVFSEGQDITLWIQLGLLGCISAGTQLEWWTGTPIFWFMNRTRRSFQKWFLCWV